MKGKKVVLAVEEKLEVFDLLQKKTGLGKTNVTCTIKLPLLFIGKSASYRPHCFTHYELNNLLVVCKPQKNVHCFLPSYCPG